ncbi:hypothetical protein [Hymenobacter rubidus]|uniref:hypothetical protein n=1 Tax=Hymenobacter rubidus TaxID=1441626 RepID=UPI00191FADB4|nr:hypothetical protein [Hymenobacter rubidus]
MFAAFITPGILGGPGARCACLLAVLALPCRAQDAILRTNGQRTEAQVLDVRGSQIFYKPWGHPDGVTTVLSTEYVQAIQYQNGTRQDFTHAPAPSLRLDEIANHGRNVVAIRPEDLVFGNLTLTYERLSKESGLGIKVPLSMGMGHEKSDYTHNAFYTQYNKIYGTGLEVNIYVTGVERVRYIVGPALQWASFRYRQRYIPSTNLQTPYASTPVETEYQGQQMSAVIQGGIWCQLGERLVFSGDAGIGLRYYRMEQADGYGHYSSFPNEATLHLSANLNLGYQF